MARFFLLLAATAMLMTSCDSGDPNKISLSEYEGKLGEAVTRHVIKTLPAIAPETPKVYTVVKGPHLQSTSMDFVRRMGDLNLNFVSGEVLTMREPNRAIVDPRSGNAPVVIQLAEMTVTGEDKWDVVAGWAYKEAFERQKYAVKKTEQGYDFTPKERLDGNYSKPEAP